MAKIKRHTINVTGVYKACQDCQAYLRFKNGELIVDGAVVITPGTGPKEFKVTAHRADCEKIK